MKNSVKRPTKNASPATALDRLNLLLAWLNGDFDEDVRGPDTPPEDEATRTDFVKVRRAVTSFVESFDGSAGAGFVDSAKPELPPVTDEVRSLVESVGQSLVRPGFAPGVEAAKPGHTPEALSDDELGNLEAMIRIVLEQGFGDATLKGYAFPTSSLGFAVRGAGRQKPVGAVTASGSRGLAGGVEAKRAFQAAGAYVLQISGDTAQLVPFLVGHLLTQRDMVGVRRCARRGDPRWLDCQRYFVVPPGAQGRPKMFCSASCRVRHGENTEREQRRKLRSSV